MSAIYRIAAELIELSRVARADRPALPRKAALKEYATVRVAGPRGAGHSTAAERLVREYFDNKAICVVPLRANCSLYTLGGPHPRWYTIADVRLRPELFLGMDLHGLVVDGASRIPDSKLEAIYGETLAECGVNAPAFTYVLLQ